jgi:riboflavin kinase/FMN adenylyltransferase
MTVEEITHPGAAFLTDHPDPRKGPPDVVEVHLIDRTLDLYDREVEVFFEKRLRDEWHFDHLDELKKQIAIDVNQARAALEK